MIFFTINMPREGSEKKKKRKYFEFLAANPEDFAQISQIFIYSDENEKETRERKFASR